jgi:hypothetical protein
VRFDAEDNCGLCGGCKGLQTVDEEEEVLRGVARRVLGQGWTRTAPPKGVVTEGDADSVEGENGNGGGSVLGVSVSVRATGICMM